MSELDELEWEPVDVPLPPPKPPRDRLTVVEDFYFRSVDNEPDLFSRRYYRELKSNGHQVYRRRVTIGAEWQSLDLGWLTGCVGMLVIGNDTGKDRQTIPTEEEQAEIDAAVVELSYNTTEHDGWIINPGESFRGQPTDSRKLLMRCRQGKARCEMFIVPE